MCDADTAFARNPRFQHVLHSCGTAIMRPCATTVHGLPPRGVSPVTVSAHEPDEHEAHTLVMASIVPFMERNRDDSSWSVYTRDDVRAVMEDILTLLCSRRLLTHPPVLGICRWHLDALLEIRLNVISCSCCDVCSKGSRAGVGDERS